MLAFSCNERLEESKSIKAGIIFKFNDLMIMISHNIEYGSRKWTREISYNGKEVIYLEDWNYEPAQVTGQSVELYDDLSSIDDKIYDVMLLYGDKVLIHN